MSNLSPSTAPNGTASQPTTLDDSPAGLAERVVALEQAVSDLLRVTGRHPITGYLLPQPGSSAQREQADADRAVVDSITKANKQAEKSRAAALERARVERVDLVAASLTGPGGHLSGVADHDQQVHFLREHLTYAMPAFIDRQQAHAWLLQNPTQPEDGCCALCCADGNHVHTRSPRARYGPSGAYSIRGAVWQP